MAFLFAEVAVVYSQTPRLRLLATPACGGRYGLVYFDGGGTKQCHAALSSVMLLVETWKQSMISRPIETLPQRDLNEGITGPATGRAEVIVAVADLVEKVEHLALRVKRITAIAGTANAEQTAKAVRRSGTGAADRNDDIEVRSAAITERNTKEIDTTEAANFPLSPRNEQNAKIETARAEPKDGNSRAKNAIAGRVLELHDRLGGFVKPPLPLPPDQKR